MGAAIAEGGVTHPSSVADRRCPCCFAKWAADLAATPVAVLPCSHAICCPCFHRWHARCMLCRLPVTGEPSPAVGGGRYRPRHDPIPPAVWAFARAAVLQAAGLSALIGRLPLSARESRAVVVTLLVEPRFDTTAAEGRLFELVMAARPPAATGGRRSPADTDAEAARIDALFTTARAPAVAAAADLAAAEAALLRPLAGASARARREAVVAVADLRRRLSAARRAGADALYAAVNAGGAAAGGAGGGGIVLDFHGLTAAEAVGRYRELVQAVLPVVRSVTLVVGRGRHSERGRGVLRGVLEVHIASSPGVRATAVPGNDGRLEVSVE